jgi:hypothetical protein
VERTTETWEGCTEGHGCHTAGYLFTVYLTCIHHLFTMHSPFVNHSFTIYSPINHHSPIVYHSFTICSPFIHQSITICSPFIHYFVHHSFTIRSPIDHSFTICSLFIHHSFSVFYSQPFNVCLLFSVGFNAKGHIFIVERKWKKKNLHVQVAKNCAIMC